MLHKRFIGKYINWEGKGNKRPKELGHHQDRSKETGNLKIENGFKTAISTLYQKLNRECFQTAPYMPKSKQQGGNCELLKLKEE